MKRKKNESRETTSLGRIRCNTNTSWITTGHKRVHTPLALVVIGPVLLPPMSHILVMSLATKTTQTLG